MTKRRIMVSIPDDVIDAMTLQVDGVEVRSLSHLIEILCSREAAQARNRTEARKRQKKLSALVKNAPALSAPKLTGLIGAHGRIDAIFIKEKHATKKKARAK